MTFRKGFTQSLRQLSADARKPAKKDAAITTLKDMLAHEADSQAQRAILYTLCELPETRAWAFKKVEEDGKWTDADVEILKAADESGKDVGEVQKARDVTMAPVTMAPVPDPAPRIDQETLQSLKTALILETISSSLTMITSIATLSNRIFHSATTTPEILHDLLFTLMQSRLDIATIETGGEDELLQSCIVDLFGGSANVPYHRLVCYIDMLRFDGESKKVARIAANLMLVDHLREDGGAVDIAERPIEYILDTLKAYRDSIRM
ncbi:uncharacterized protein EV422DRAFT_526599 [Fimicolochytrium jonesii]|uniref:uncharacterized protein n=1 Tax=Fimicolochytrium jonesii TaxID=1396493 RepID=UPI0022FE6D81|nr:uncharacterized protein EV422DRAFT_526599 [Fimicolochytrium jonesii]KAI8821695.1 hypothetical protein EV422DRAFT_526599 [Fimicolochytrium jonesii]